MLSQRLSDKSNQVLLSGLRLLVGTVFLVAGIAKFTNPGAFSSLLHSYHILTPFMETLTVFLFPGFELIIGLLLILGFLRRWVTLTALMLTAIFAAANILSVTRGIRDCGCFGEVLPLSAGLALVIDCLMAFSLVLIFLFRGTPVHKVWYRSLKEQCFLTVRLFASFTLLLVSLVPSTAIAAPQAAQNNTGHLEAISKEPGVSPLGSIRSQISSAKDSDKPYVLYFFSQTCPHCQEQSPAIEALRQAYSDRVSFASIDGMANPELRSEYGVTGFPTTILGRGAGRTEKLSGFRTLEELASRIDSLSGEIREKAVFVKEPNLQNQSQVSRGLDDVNAKFGVFFLDYPAHRADLFVDVGGIADEYWGPGNWNTGMFTTSIYRKECDWSQSYLSCPGSYYNEILVFSNISTKSSYCMTP